MSARVLVVDDVDVNVRLLEAKLSSEYFQVIPSFNGPTALELADSEMPDIILLDVMMPRVSGLQACQQIRTLERKTGRRVPVLFLTARDTTHDKTSAALSGGDDFIAKPVSLQELREHVEAALKKAKP